MPTFVLHAFGKPAKKVTLQKQPIKVGRDEVMTDVPAGMSCLIPAVFGSYAIHVKPDVETTVVKTSL